MIRMSGQLHRGSAQPQRTSLDRLGLILVVIAAFGMASMTWKKWADPVIDFGTELYVPWRIYEGDVIFRDVTHTYAPIRDRGQDEKHGPELIGAERL